MPIIRTRTMPGRKPWCTALLLLLPVLLSNGCATMSNTDKGVLAGGGIGAGTGALIGSATGHTGLGAVAGGVVGAVSGGLVGSAVDKAERAEARAAAAAAPAPLNPTDIVRLSHERVREDIIIAQIRSTGSAYRLTADDIIWLRQNGVSENVISEMQATAYRLPRRVYGPAPVVERVYIVEPPPPPVSVGIGYTWRGGR